MIFVDTGPFVARSWSLDQYHAPAQRGWMRVLADGGRVYTSQLVLVEFATLLGRWTGNRYAAERVRRVYASSAIHIIYSDRDVELKALGLFEKYSDQKVSFTDCVSFTLMRQHRIQRVFTFDRHFTLAGFDVFRPA